MFRIHKPTHHVASSFHSVYATVQMRRNRIAAFAIFVGVCLIASASLRGQTQVPTAGSGSPSVLPGDGLREHPFLYCGEWNYIQQQQVMWLIRDGKVSWSYSIPLNVMFNNKKDISELGDCTQLSNGNIVFSTRLGAAEVTPDRQIVWQIFNPIGTETHSIQPIGLDRVLIVQNGNPARLLLINTKNNEIEKSITVPVRDPSHPHGQLRRARMTATGTFLVAQLDLGRVSEYDDTGKMIWNFPTESPWDAVRLKNGNTLITGDAHGYVKEVNPAGNVVWSMMRSDFPGYVIGNIQDVQRLDNGDTVFSNWIPNTLKPESWATTAQIIEVDQNKHVVWALRSWGSPSLGPASGLQLLDQSGVPENLGQQR